MKDIQITAKFKIHTGRVEEFKKLQQNVCLPLKKMKRVRYGTIGFFNPDQTECVVRETYADSNAVHAHMGNVGALLGQLLAIYDFNLEVHGNMSEELKNKVAGLIPKVYSFYQGL